LPNRNTYGRFLPDPVPENTGISLSSCFEHQPFGFSSTFEPDKHVMAIQPFPMENNFNLFIIPLQGSVPSFIPDRNCTCPILSLGDGFFKGPVFKRMILY